MLKITSDVEVDIFQHSLTILLLYVLLQLISRLTNEVWMFLKYHCFIRECIPTLLLIFSSNSYEIIILLEVAIAEFDNNKMLIVLNRFNNEDNTLVTSKSNSLYR